MKCLFHDPDQTLHPTVSDMNLYCLIISYKKVHYALKVLIISLTEES